MSKRHQANRRRTYGRRQHEIRERRERPWPAGGVDHDLADEGLAGPEAIVVEHRALPYGATWLGLE